MRREFCLFRRLKLIIVVTLGRDAAFEAWSHGYSVREYAAELREERPH